MKKQIINSILALLVILVFIPYVGYAECGKNITTEKQSTTDYSQVNTDKLYQLYVDNVLMNNPYIHQMNHLGYNYETLSNELFLIESNFVESELYLLAQEEVYLQFKEWIKDEEGRKDFITKMDTYNNPDHSVKNYILANQAIQ